MSASDIKKECKFSICTLYRNAILYKSLYEMLEKNGYLQEVEFLSIENSKNTWECYSAIRYFLENARGEYVVICHEDVDLGDLNIREFDLALQTAIEYDPLAAVFGIAGISRFSHRGCGHFFSNRGEENWGVSDHGRAVSLDECFLVIKKSAGITVSPDLSGFHFYGADLCLNSERLGWRNYVIEFPIGHRSTGTLDEIFFAARDCFETHLKDLEHSHFVPTTCTLLYGGKSHLLQGFALAISYLMVKKSGHPNAMHSMDVAWRRGIKSYGSATFILLAFFGEIYLGFRKLCEYLNGLWRWFFVGVIFWKIIYPLSWPLRRLVGDACWWLAKLKQNKRGPLKGKNG